MLFALFMPLGRQRRGCQGRDGGVHCGRSWRVQLLPCLQTRLHAGAGSPRNITPVAGTLAAALPTPCYLPVPHVLGGSAPPGCTTRLLHDPPSRPPPAFPLPQPAAPGVGRGWRAVARRPLLPQPLLCHPRPPAAAAVPCARQRSVSGAAAGSGACHLSPAVASSPSPGPHLPPPVTPTHLPSRAARLWRPAVEAPAQLRGRRGVPQLRVKVPAAFTNIAPVSPSAV